jgi:glutathione peroxidase
MSRKAFVARTIYCLQKTIHFGTRILCFLPWFFLIGLHFNDVFLKDLWVMKNFCSSQHSTRFVATICTGLTLFVGLVAQATSALASCPPLLNQKFTSLQGKPQDFCSYSGKVVVVVNTASYCGFTEQYKGLQTIYDKYKDKGLVVVGFPANDFGKQEPGSNAEVADFCERTYKVKFPMVEKTSVLEGQANSLHEALFKATGERPKWNFHKYLIARDGRAVQSFGSKVAPESPEFVAQIEKLLATK